MSKRFLISAAVALVVGVLGVLLLHEYTDPKHDRLAALSDKELAEAARKNIGEAPAPASAPLPIDPKRRVRLAIGSLGLSGDDQNRQVADRTLAQLTGAKGLEMVERQELDAVLRELSLSVSGLVRAKDAIRVGKLVRADWFLLGSRTSLNGTNYTVVRVVDARTGVLREAGVFASDQSPPRLASALPAFVRQCRQNAAEAKSAVYLSVGSFEDFSLNNRHPDLPRQLRSYLTTAYQQTSIPILRWLTPTRAKCASSPMCRPTRWTKSKLAAVTSGPSLTGTCIGLC